MVKHTVKRPSSEGNRMHPCSCERGKTLQCQLVVSIRNPAVNSETPHRSIIYSIDQPADRASEQRKIDLLHKHMVKRHS